MSRLGVVVLVAWLAVCSATAATSPEVSRERQVKAAFLFSVLKFVDWPAAALPAATSPLLVAVLEPRGPSELSTALNGKTIKGRPLIVRSHERVEDIGTCHVLFVTSDAAADLREALHVTQGRPVLTVSEQTGQTATPAIITLTVVDTKLAFHVNLDTADAGGLQVSSNLLGLAKSVQSARLKQNRP